MSYEVMLVANSILYFLILIFLFRTFFLHDTFVDSPFFSIDRVRTIRYVTGYFLVLVVSASVVLFTGLIILGALGSLITGIVISIVNAFILLFWLISSFFTSSSLQFLSYNLVPVVFSSVVSFGSTISEEIGFILVVVFIFLALTFSSYFLGRYVEDSDTALAAIIYSHLLLFSLFMTLTMMSVTYTGINNNILITGVDSDFAYLIIPPVTLILSYLLSRQVFLQKEDQQEYELPELNKWVKRLVTAVYLVLSILFVGMIGSSLYRFFFSDFLSKIPTLVGVVLISLPGIFLVVSLLFWIIHGDFPTDVRIFEIEYREELLEKAEEFKAL